MRTGTAIKYKHFAPLLDAKGVKYKETDYWLNVGKPDLKNKWILYISVCAYHSPQLVEAVLPLLCSRNVSFKVVKNQMMVQQMNWGELVLPEAGKVLTIYPGSEEDSVNIANEIQPLIACFDGQVIAGCLRVGKLVYASYSKLITPLGVKKPRPVVCIPPKSKIPFVTDRKYRPKSKWSLIGAMIWRGIISKKLIRDHTKGNVYKGVNLRDLSNWCLIKWGYAFAAGDVYGRTIRDRFLWQKEVLQDLHGSGVPVPRFITYFEQNGDCCLVVDYIEGVEIGKRVRQLLDGVEWKDAAKEVQTEIVGYYKEALRIVQLIHQKGYVYRDITDVNFIVTPAGKLVIVDPELCYSFVKAKPFPAFMLGTPGYHAPEQETQPVPDYKQDIYSLGAFLSLLLTKEDPVSSILPDRNRTRRHLLSKCNNPVLVDIFAKCVQLDPDRRPGLAELIELMENADSVSRIQENRYQKAI